MYEKNKFSMSSRAARASADGYFTKSIHEVSTQTKERRAHETMMPTNIKFRESRDSDVNPLTIAIQVYLDVTGSMLDIPQEMLRSGLPTLMSTLTQYGIPDAVLMFGAIGDHEADRFPLQVGQFESGDAELDLWLTRTYLEANGGGNSGESYLLAWYFAAYHTVTDNCEKRGEKGFVFTIGDEPCLPNLPVSAIKDLMGTTVVTNQKTNYTMAELLTAAQECNNVFHIFVEHGRRQCNPEWKELLGQNLIIVKDHTEIPKIIANTVYSYHKLSSVAVPVTKEDDNKEPVKTKITL